jgi:hypothetical protein
LPFELEDALQRGARRRVPRQQRTGQEVVADACGAYVRRRRGGVAISSSSAPPRLKLVRAKVAHVDDANRRRNRRR